MPLTLPLRCWHIVFRNERVWPARGLLERDDYERHTTNLIESENPNEVLLDVGYDPSHMRGDPRVVSVAEAFVLTEDSPWPEDNSARHLDVCGCQSIMYHDLETALREIATVDEGVKTCLELRDSPDARLAGLARECLGGKEDAVGVLADLLEEVQDPRAAHLREAHLGKPAEQLEAEAEPLLRIGHNNILSGVKFLPGGQLLTSSFQPEMHVWALADGSLARRIPVEVHFTGHSMKGARYLHASRDGTRVLSRPRYDSLFHGWRFPGGHEWFTYEVTPARHIGDHAGAAALSAHGGLAACSCGPSVHLVDTGTAEPLGQFHLEYKVTAAAFSPDDSLLAVGAQDGTLSLRNPANGREVRALSGHRREVFDLHFSPDGRWLASCSEDKSVRVWDVAAGRQAQQFSFADVHRVQFSPDGKYLVAATTKGIVRAWELDGGRQALQFRASAWSVSDLAFDESGELLATAAGHDVAVWEWSPASRPTGLPGRELARGTISHCAGLRLELGEWVSAPAVALTPDGSQLLTGSHDGWFELWGAESGERLQAWRSRFPGAMLPRVAFSPDGELMATGCSFQDVEVRQRKGGKLLCSWPIPAQALWHLAFTPDGKSLACCLTVAWEGRGTVEFINPKKGGPPLRTLAGHIGHVKVVAFSPDGQWIGTGSDDGTVRIWSADGEVVATVIISTASNGRNTDSMAFSPDGKRLALSSADVALKVLEVPSGKEICCAWPGGVGDGLRFAPSGKSIVAAGRGITFNDSTDGKPGPVSLQPDAVYPTGLGMSADGLRLVSGSLREDRHLGPGAAMGGSVRVWELAGEGAPQAGLLRTASRPRRAGDAAAGLPKPKVLRVSSSRAPGIGCLRFSPDGKRLAVWSDEVVGVWDVESGKRLFALEGPGGRSAEKLAFSPDGSLLVGAGGERDLLAWEMQTGHLVSYRKVAASWFHCLDFLPDGTLVIGQSDRSHYDAHSVRFWDALEGTKHQRALTGQLHAFSPDGKTVAVSEEHVYAVQLVDVASGGQLRELVLPLGSLNAAAFSPDGRYVAAVIRLARSYITHLGAVFVWEARTGELVARLPMDAPVATLAFADGGERVLAGDLQGTHVWDVRTSERLATLPLVDHSEDGLQVSPDGRWLASARAGGEIHLYPLASFPWATGQLAPAPPPPGDLYGERLARLREQAASGELALDTGKKKAGPDREVAQAQADASDVPCPNCGEEGRRRAFRVTKEGANKGRIFVKCLDCDDFQWVTAAPVKETKQEAAPAASAKPEATPCPKCGAARKVFQVKKEGPNTGRWFLKCSDGECDSFEWAPKAEAEAPAAKKKRKKE